MGNYTKKIRNIRMGVGKRTTNSLGDNRRKIVRTWIEESARVIKDLDANHLVTTGAEGKNGKDWKCASAAILVRNNMQRHMGREHEKKLYS